MPGKHIKEIFKFHIPNLLKHVDRHQVDGVHNVTSQFINITRNGRYTSTVFYVHAKKKKIEDPKVRKIEWPRLKCLDNKYDIINNNTAHICK